MKQIRFFKLISLLFGISFFCAVACTNQTKATGTCSDPTTIDGLWNCKKGSCTGKCMLQVGTIMNGDTTWKDIPGGNLNPEDVGKNQILRCDCR